MEKGRSVRERILETALEEFLRRGYEGVSIRELIEPLGISKGGFYHHYASKEELFVAVVNLVLSEWSSTIQGIVEDATLSVEARTRKLFLSPLARSGAYYGLLSEGLRVEASVQERTKAVIGELLRQYERLLAEGQSRGEVREFLDCKTWAFQIAATVEGGYLLASLGGVADLKTQLLAAFENTWRGVKPLSL